MIAMRTLAPFVRHAFVSKGPQPSWLGVTAWTLDEALHMYAICQPACT